MSRGIVSPYCTVLYCTVLYCIVLDCIVLYCTVLYCTVLYCTVLYCTVLYCIVLDCIVLYCIVLYCIVLYWIVLDCYFLFSKIIICTYHYYNYNNNNNDYYYYIIITLVPSISITVSPSTTDIVDFSPYNSVSLNCTASIPTGITVDIKFQWLQGSVVLNSTDSLSITQDNGSSSLVGQIDTAGTHQYTCNLIVTLSLLDPPVTSSDNVTVNVQGWLVYNNYANVFVCLFTEPANNVIIIIIPFGMEWGKR